MTTTSKMVAPLAPLSPKPKPRPTVTREGSGAKASPLARKIALERGVDLSRITGTGPGGRIVAADITQQGTSSSRPAAAPAPQLQIPVPFSDADTKTPLSGMRRTIAERLLISKTQIPHFYLTMEIDAGPLS
ncbi:dihydrolipoamide acetyltransferase, partial [bacterium]|nr:dihydrolipoamide acetyltransferase [bacterium]